MTRTRAGVAALGLVILVAVAVIMMLLDRTSDQPLDPQNPGQYGAQALATVLSEQGVHVHRVDTPDSLAKHSQGSDTTILISDPTLLSAQRLAQFGRSQLTSARIILIAPDPKLLAEAFGITATATGSDSPVPAGAGCALPWASGLQMPAHTVLYGNIEAGVESCFDTDSGAGAFQVDASNEHPLLLVVGSPDVLMNHTMKQGDNAAVGLRALGQTSQLVWYSGGYDAQSSAAKHPAVFPRWVRPALWLIAAVTVLLMLWRGRRFGRLVPEPLPVIVHANETTTARGQLYRKARDTARTSTILRAATRGRLRRFLGLAPGTSTDEIVRQVAAHSGRSPQDVGALIVENPQPITEAELNRLARELTDLERQVRR